MEAHNASHCKVRNLLLNKPMLHLPLARHCLAWIGLGVDMLMLQTIRVKTTTQYWANARSMEDLAT
eukprot:3011238-Amphidinium_carterae.1